MSNHHHSSERGRGDLIPARHSERSVQRLFEPGLQPLMVPDATMTYAEAWQSRETSDRWMQELLTEVPWSQHHVRLFGRKLASPRLSSWHGDADASYRYSGSRHLPLPWTPALARIRDCLLGSTQVYFNGVLANRYRDGNDSMGWHADDEAELGTQPLIASVSLGAERRFCMKHRRSGQRLQLRLAHGSLLLMAGDSQKHWLHSLPKDRAVSQPRLNLTFRQIIGRTHEQVSELAAAQPD